MLSNLKKINRYKTFVNISFLDLFYNFKNSNPEFGYYICVQIILKNNKMLT